jgi:hypothetical protein
MDSAEGEPSGYGFRVGAPRAQGPDPYGRFEGTNEPPSNVRHFPTRGEPSDNLKLSDLLGRSAVDETTSADGKSDGPGKTSHKTRAKRSDSAKSSDDSE